MWERSILLPLMFSLKQKEGIYVQHTIMTCFILLLVLFGCSPSNEAEKDNNGANQLEMTKLSTKQSINQDTANKVKEAVGQFKEITSVKAIEVANKMVIAFEVKHIYRFQLEKLRSAVKDKVKKMYPDIEPTVSTDQKIFMEVEKIEKNIRNYSKEKLKEKVDKIIKMDKDQT